MIKAKRTRKANSRKGQMRVIEAIIASLIVISAVMFLYAYAAVPSTQIYETSELEKIGYNVLHDIDEQRLLTRYIYNSEWANLTAALMVSIPTHVYFNLTIYDVEGNAVSHPLIQYGSSHFFTTSKAVASVTYIVSGYQTNYNPRLLVLKLVEG